MHKPVALALAAALTLATTATALPAGIAYKGPAQLDGNTLYVGDIASGTTATLRSVARVCAKPNASLASLQKVIKQGTGPITFVITNTCGDIVRACLDNGRTYACHAFKPLGS